MTTSSQSDRPAESRADDSVEPKASRAIGLARSAEEQVRKNDAEWIAELALKWKFHHGQGLKLRHETGQSLNSRFGLPTERQRRGDATMELVSKETGVDVSELNRARWFAFRFPDFAVFQTSYPKVTTWTQVRLLLVEMSKNDNSAQDSSDDKSSQDEKSSAEFRKVKQSLKVLVGLLDRPLPLDEDANDELALGLRKLSRALKRAFGVEVTVSGQTEVADA